MAVVGVDNIRLKLFYYFKQAEYVKRVCFAAEIQRGGVFSPFYKLSVLSADHQAVMPSFCQTLMEEERLSLSSSPFFSRVNVKDSQALSSILKQ